MATVTFLQDKFLINVGSIKALYLWEMKFFGGKFEQFSAAICVYVQLKY